MVWDTFTLDLIICEKLKFQSLYLIKNNNNKDFSVSLLLLGET